MSVKSGNRLWNRLLARAEARAAKGTPPEPHHYRPVSASDDHLRSSFENSLIYHGLKIETEFNLRLQPTPRKRKTKRKSDLPVAERLRNDRAVAGSPGPTHRTPTGTPTRRISKSTPLSRPPIPIPPPLPPIPVTAKGAAAEKHVLNAASDDDGPPAPCNPPMVELCDSSDDALPLASAKRESGSGPVLTHFDLAPDSDDISSWEDDAILVVQPSKVGECPNDEKLARKDMAKILGKKTSAEDLRAPYKTSKKDRVRRARARNVADSDSSLAGDSDSGKIKHTKESSNQRTPVGESSRALLKRGSNSDRQGMAARERNPETSNSQPNTSINGESSSKQKVSKQGSTVESHTISDMRGSNRSLLSEELLARITTIKKKDPKVASGANHVVSLNSSSDEETPSNYRSNPPMRALTPRRRTPPNVSIQDKLFGRLSPLSSPRRRTRSMSSSKKRSSQADAVSTPMEQRKTPASRQKDIQDSCETSDATGGKAKRPTSTPLRRISNRLIRDTESRKRDREEEVIATCPANLKATATGKSSSPIGGASRQKKTKISIEEGSLGDLSDEIFDVDLMTVEVNKIQNLPKNIKRNKTPPSSSLSESTIEVEESNGNQRISAIRRKSRNQVIPLSVNATLPRQHRVTPKALETTGNPRDVLEILDGDSDVCPASVSPVVKRRRVTRNKQGCERVDILQQGEKVPSKEQSKESSAESVSRGFIQPPEATKQENKGDKRSGVNRALPLRLPRSVIYQEHLNRSTKDSSTKSTSPSSDSSSETIKQDIQREERSGVNRRISSRARRYAAAQKHRKASSGSTKQNRIESSPEICPSPPIDLQIESKQDMHGSSKLSIPLRLRRHTTTEESGAANSKSPRESSDESEDLSRSPSKNTQKQAKRDVGSGSNNGPPSRNRRRTTSQKQKKSSSITPRGRVWDSLSDKMKQRIQKALNGEADYDSDDSFDSELSGRKRRRKYAVYQDGRVKEITDWKA